MAESTLFKELLKQVKCDTTPGIGFTQADLDQVKSCVAKVKPTESFNFDPNTDSDQDQLDQANYKKTRHSKL